jgi:hypothetical protein
LVAPTVAQPATGNAAELLLDPVDNKWKAVYQGRTIVRSFNREYVIGVIEKGLNQTAKACGVTHVVELNSGSMGQLLQANNFEIPQRPEFSITERFEFLENLTTMAIEGSMHAVLITGEGGLGKSHTVMAGVKAAGLTLTTDFSPPVVDKDKKKDANAEGGDGEDGDDDDDDVLWMNPGQVHVVKGYSSPKGLYRTLFENNGKLIIFDDCDSIQKNADAVNILKGALDSSDERWISWGAEEGRPRAGVIKLPKSFRFTGRVIFISNFSQQRIDGNLKTRCARVDLTMTQSEKIERMTTIIQQPSFQPDVSMEIKEIALAFLDENKELATALSIRSLNETIAFRKANRPNWERQALYSLCA